MKISLKEKIVSPALLRELLSYDPSDGSIRWKARESPPNWNSRFLGKIAGSVCSNDGSASFGYRYISISVYGDSYKFLAHRVAWAHFYGDWPKYPIDHLNGDTDDNRICNLRVSEKKENSRNARKRKDNASGYTGVTELPSGRFRAVLMAGGKQRHVGVFDTPREAYVALKRVRRKIGYTERHGE